MIWIGLALLLLALMGAPLFTIIAAAASRIMPVSSSVSRISSSRATPRLMRSSPGLPPALTGWLAV